MNEVKSGTALLAIDVLVALLRRFDG